MISACIAIVGNLCIYQAEAVRFASAPPGNIGEVSIHATVEGSNYKATLWSSPDHMPEFIPGAGKQVCDGGTCVRYAVDCTQSQTAPETTQCDVEFAFPRDDYTSTFFIEFDQRVSFSDVAKNLGLVDLNGSGQIILLSMLAP